MMIQILLFLLHVFMVGTCTIDPQNEIQATDFETMTGIDYVPAESFNLIGNITDNSVYSVGECARKCLEYEMCATGTFYSKTQRCLLYREMCGVGGLINVGVETASTVCLTSRNPAVTYCVQSGHDIILQNNQFIYSPNQLYAFGIKTPNWSLFHVGAYGKIGSNYWQPSGNIPAGCSIKLQNDGNLVLYYSSGGAAWAFGVQNGGNGPPFGFYVLNTGELVWLDLTNQIVVQYP